MNTSKTKRFVKHKLQDASPTVWIGKEGLTTQSIDEIEKQLKKSRMLKIKILKSALQEETKKNIAAKAAQQTGALLVDLRGNIFILYRRTQKPAV
ncbi:YhbY family RNA-binding protein [Candidatus Bathyarchaeota archaeon]|nr:YhbY family RNA-binding protein [Candidatus Bathyarchaeota archaeon]